MRRGSSAFISPTYPLLPSRHAALRPAHRAPPFCSMAAATARAEKLEKGREAETAASPTAATRRKEPRVPGSPPLSLTTLRDPRHHNNHHCHHHCHRHNKPTRTPARAREPEDWAPATAGELRQAKGRRPPSRSVCPIRGSEGGAGFPGGRGEAHARQRKTATEQRNETRRAALRRHRSRGAGTKPSSSVLADGPTTTSCFGLRRWSSVAALRRHRRPPAPAFPRVRRVSRPRATAASAPLPPPLLSQPPAHPPLLSLLSRCGLSRVC